MGKLWLVWRSVSGARREEECRAADHRYDSGSELGKGGDVIIINKLLTFINFSIPKLPPVNQRMVFF